MSDAETTPQQPGSEPETPFVMTANYHDGQSVVNAYATLERATWNFTEQIIKPYTIEATITVDGGSTEIARWRRDKHKYLTIQTSDRVDAVYDLLQSETSKWLRENGARATGPMLQAAGRDLFRKIIGPLVAETTSAPREPARTDG
jgi:hypothetical protein